MLRIILYVALFSIFGIFVLSNHYAEATCITLPPSPMYPQGAQLGDCSTPTSKLDNNGYEKTGFLLIHNPTICMTKTTDSRYPEVQNLPQMTIDAANDWFTQLDYVNPVFNGKYLVVGDATSFDYSTCDITISYQPEPAQSANDVEPMGFTQYDFNKHSASIVVYYELLDYKGSSTTSGKYIIHSMTPYFTNKFASDAQLKFTLRHELGHAFGLGHYASFAGNWDAGRSIPSLSSLMISSIGPIGYDQFNQISVKSNDVTELVSLYGKAGFNTPVSEVPTRQSSVLPTTQSPITVQTDQSSYESGNSIRITGLVTNPNAGDTVTISISKPDGHISLLNILFFQKVNLDGTYVATYSNTNDNSWDQSGTYTVNAILDLDITHKTSVAGAHTTFQFTDIQNSSKVLNMQLKDMIKNDIRSGHISDSEYEKTFYVLKQEGLIHLPQNYKNSGYLKKPSWLDEVSESWAENEISDEEYGNTMQYLIEKQLLQV